MADVTVNLKKVSNISTIINKEGWFYGDTTIQNGTGQNYITTSIYASDEALRKHLNLATTTPENAATFFSDAQVIKKINVILASIQALSKTLGAYPSISHPANKCKIIFDDLKGTAVANFQYANPPEFTYFIICIDLTVALQDQYKDTLAWVLKHELLHGVSKVAENERAVTDQYRAKDIAEQRIIKNDFDIITQQTQELLKLLKQPELLSLTSRFKGLSLANILPRAVKQLILNYFCDTMLTVIAMEHNDDTYVKFAIEKDEAFVNKLKTQMAGFKVLREEMEQRKQAAKTDSERRKMRVHQIIFILMEINQLLDYFPFRGTPAVLLDKLRNNIPNPYKYSSDEYKTSIFKRAETVWQEYTNIVNSCHAKEEMSFFADSYLTSVTNNVPKADEALHSTPQEYAQTALMYETIMTKYIDLLKKNIE